MRFLILEVSEYNVYITNKPLLLKGAGEKNPLVEVTVNSKEENTFRDFRFFVPITFKNSASVDGRGGGGGSQWPNPPSDPLQHKPCFWLYTAVLF